MLVELKKLPKKAKRVGRGVGSSKGGHTVGKGSAGQGARGKGKTPPGFEGGNIPLYRKIPTLKGFNSRTVVTEVSMKWIASHTKKGDVVDKAFLKGFRFNVDVNRVKIVGNESIDHEITVKGLAITKGARASIEKAGGKIETVTA